MDGFEYEIAMRDSLGAPARAGAASLDKLKGSIEGVDHALKSAHGGAHTFASGISYAVRGFDDLARGGRYAANGVLDVGKAFSRLGPLLLGAAVVGGATALARFAFEASEAKEQTIEAFSVFEGSAEKGARTFRVLDEMASSVHMPAEKVAGLAKELLELGLEDQNTLFQTVRSIETLQRVGLSSGADRIKQTVERSLAAGHLVLGRGGAGAARALTGTGIGEADVAAQLGISPKQLEAQLKAGKISVQDGLAAIDQAIIQGKVGALATKKFTVSDAFTDLHNSVRRLFQESDTSPITDSLRRLTEGFEDGTAGARTMSDVVDGIFAGVGAAIDGVRDLGRAFGETADWVLDKWDAVDDFIAGVGKSDADKDQIARKRRATNAGRHLSEAVEDQDKAFKKVQDLAAGGASAAEIQKTAARLGISVDVVKGGALGPHERAITSMERTDAKGALVVDRSNGELHFDNPASALAGIPSGSPGNPVDMDNLKELGKNAGKALHDGAAGPEGLDAHSPSRKMFDLGVDAADGFQSGAQAGRDMTGPAPTGKSLSVHVDVGGIALHGSIDADEFMPLLESQIADVFERAALELGQ